eukprot:gene1274-1442_t
MGIRDPVSFIRRLKTQYVETIDQEKFLYGLPAVADTRLTQGHPLLVKAIVTERIIDSIFSGRLKLNVDFQPEAETIAQYEAAFDIIDVDLNGFIRMDEMVELFTQLGADVRQEAVAEFFEKGGEERLSKAEFVQIMTERCS